MRTLTSEQKKYPKLKGVIKQETKTEKTQNKNKNKVHVSSPRKSCWSLEVEGPLNLLSGPRRPYVDCLLFWLAASLALEVFIHYLPTVSAFIGDCY